MKKKLPKVVVSAIKKELKPKVTKKVVAIVDSEPEVIEEVMSVESNKILESISHPNKKILAGKILNGVSSEDLIKEYGNTRVLEMSKYIETYSINLNKNAELKAKRGCNGVCIACQK